MQCTSPSIKQCALQEGCIVEEDVNVAVTMEYRVPIVLVFCLVVGCVLCNNNHEESPVVLKTPPSHRGQLLWFAPALARKKRAPTGIYSSPALDRQQLEALIELIQESPWSIVSVNEGKRYDVNFVPRLGRESGEDGGGGVERLVQPQENDFGVAEQIISQRSPPFAPRLGKRVLPFAPRLGRENFPDRV